MAWPGADPPENSKVVGEPATAVRFPLRSKLSVPEPCTTSASPGFAGASVVSATGSVAFQSQALMPVRVK
jgi:hypothetical protein